MIGTSVVLCGTQGFSCEHDGSIVLALLAESHDLSNEDAPRIYSFALLHYRSQLTGPTTGASVASDKTCATVGRYPNTISE